MKKSAKTKSVSKRVVKGATGFNINIAPKLHAKLCTQAENAGFGGPTGWQTYILRNLKAVAGLK